MSTEMVKYDPATALEPRNAEQALSIAEHLAGSSLLGKLKTRDAVFAVILAGRELGLPAMQSLRAIHLVDGKVSLSAGLMVALVKRHSSCKYFRLVESSGTIATYETERIGEGVTRMSFTIEEARAAGLLSKDNWKKYPAAMLRARCSSALASAVYPDAMVGVYDEDEIGDGNGWTAPAPVDRAAAAPPASDNVVDVEVVEPAPVEEPVVTVAAAAPPSVQPLAETPAPKTDEQRYAEIEAAMIAAKTRAELDAATAKIAAAFAEDHPARATLRDVWMACNGKLTKAA